MTTTWNVNVVDLRHRRAINDNSLDLQLMVTKLTNGVPVTWNPWTSPTGVVNDAGIPIPGGRLEDYENKPWASVLGTFASWAEFYRVRSVEWQLVPGSVCTYSCTIRSTDRMTYCPEPLIRRSDATGIRLVDRYRNATPTDTTADGTAITGTAYTEVGGKPERFRVSQIRVDLVLPWRTDLSTYTDGHPDLVVLIGNKVQKVNSTAFLGFDARSLMLMGVTVDPKEDEFLEVTVSFLWDSWYHFEQEPDREINGDVIREFAGSPAVARAKTVRWRDMSRGTTDFGTMFSADEEAWAQFGWQTWETACNSLAASETYTTTKTEALTTIRIEPEPEPEPEEEE